MRYCLALITILIIVVPAVFGVSAEPQGTAGISADLNSAGALYSRSVDLANEGRYQEALDASDKALAMNVTSLTALIQSNRAGILVMLHRYDDAITAADAALAIQGNLTTAHSVAWYNRGNALRALGRIPEAQDAYARASDLDTALVPPDMSNDVTLSQTKKSPFSFAPVLAALCLAAGVVWDFRKK
jgi:tetratricopeptide (TPR) repeat protein